MAPIPLKPNKTPEYISLGEDTTYSSNTFTMNFKLKPMPKHTNLPNEITGEYYKEKTPYFTIAMVYIVFLIALIVFVLSILDTIFGAETVTNFIADLLGSLMG